MSGPSTSPDRVTWRFRLVTSCLVLVAVAFWQRPGQLVGDTKLDLVVDPGGMVAAAECPVLVIGPGHPPRLEQTV